MILKLSRHSDALLGGRKLDPRIIQSLLLIAESGERQAKDYRGRGP